jgi:hypothetical protein
MENKTRIQERNHTLATTTTCTRITTYVLSALAPKRIVRCPKPFNKSEKIPSKRQEQEKVRNDEYPGNCDWRKYIGGWRL